jgi:hypothetical protein
MLKVVEPPRDLKVALTPTIHPDFSVKAPNFFSNQRLTFHPDSSRCHSQAPHQDSPRSSCPLLRPHSRFSSVAALHLQQQQKSP